MAISTIQQELESLERQIGEKASKLMELQTKICDAQPKIQQQLEVFGQESVAVLERKLQYSQSVEMSKQACSDALAKCDTLLAQKESSVDKIDTLLQQVASQDELYQLKITIFRASATFKWHQHPVTYNSSQGSKSTESAYVSNSVDEKIEKTHFGNVNGSSIEARANRILGRSRSSDKGIYIPFPNSHPSLHGWKFTHDYWQPPN